MDRNDARSRRRVLRTAVAVMTASTALVAGCTEEGEDESGDEAEAEEGTGNGQEREGDEPDEAEEDGGISDEDSGDSEENERAEVEDAESWDDVEEILLATDEDVWVGEEPSLIEGEENPTLELVADREYEIGFVVRDEEEHNLLIQGDDGQHGSTQITDEEGEEVWQTIDASEELTEYRCDVHPETMVGEIETVEDANGDGD